MKNQQKNKQPMDTPTQHAGTLSASSNGSRKDSIPDVQHVRNLIERCLMLDMNRDDVVRTLLTREKIHPIFTNAVWERLEEEKKEFFMKIHVAPAMRYPVQQHPQMHVPGHPHVVKGVHAPAMRYPVPKHPQMHVPGHPHVVKGVPAPANFQPLRMNSTNDMVIDTTVDDSTTPKVIPPNSSGGMSEKAVSPASVASDMVMDTSMVDSDVGGGGAGNSRDSFDQFDWNSISTEHILGLDLPSVVDLDKFLAELFDLDKDKPLS